MSWGLGGKPLWTLSSMSSIKAVTMQAWGMGSGSLTSSSSVENCPERASGLLFLDPRR